MRFPICFLECNFRERVISRSIWHLLLYRNSYIYCMKWFLQALIVSLVFLSAQARNKPVSQSAKNDEILVDPILHEPSFPGGQKAFGRFLSRNLKWPDPDIDARGKVIISFTVEKDGRLTGFKVKKGMGEPFDEEAVRVLQKSPKWKPATKNSKPVKAEYMVPINFTLTY